MDQRQICWQILRRVKFPKFNCSKTFSYHLEYLDSLLRARAARKNWSENRYSVKRIRAYGALENIVVFYHLTAVQYSHPKWKIGINRQYRQFNPRICFARGRSFRLVFLIGSSAKLGLNVVRRIIGGLSDSLFNPFEERWYPDTVDT